MATYTVSNPNRSSVLNPGQPQPFGSDGKELNKKIAGIEDSFTKGNSLQWLVQRLVSSNNERHCELRAYLNSLSAEAISTGEIEFTTRVLENAWLVWEELRNHFVSTGKFLEVPDACPGTNNNFMFTWSKAEHYFECEIFGNGEVEFFYRNRNNSNVWGEDTTIGQEFSADILEKALLFTW